MSTLFRNKLTKLFLICGLLVCSAKASHALPIDHITILFGNTNPFTAGVSTNSVGGSVVFVNTFDSANGIPTAGESVFLQLLDSGGNPISSGMLPSTFTTTGTGQQNGGNSGLPYTFFSAGTSLQLKAFTTSGVTQTGPVFVVVSSSAAKLLLVGPGMTHVPGTNPLLTTGVSGTFTSQETNQPFPISVILTDKQFNTVTTADTITFDAVSDVTFPAGPNVLGNTGQGSFNIILTAPKVSRTITARDTSDTNVAIGTLDINSAGPPEEEVFPFPNPFNPKTGSITFRFRLETPKDVGLKVVDRFGQSIWSRTISGGTGFTDTSWDGKNDNGTVVAVGVYYVMLEVGGSIKNKRSFGVVK